MAKITIQRKAGGSPDPIRKYKVVIDGEEVGKVGRGESVTAEVQPGPHDVQLKLGSGRSPVMNVEASSDEEVRLHCEPAANLLTAPYLALFASYRCINLERA